MLEMMVLSVFAIALVLCIVLDLSILIALVFGYFVFCAYALYKKHKIRDVLTMTVSGIKTVKNILITFVLIGIITAVWRASGTIPFIVYHSTRFCSPRTMVLASFLLCGLVSLLTGTAFGTAATMGVICAAISNSMGISPVLSGGAILAGSFFGDRCSPMSTSALLVSSLTGTDIFRNIKEMLRTGAVPFVLTCIVYLLFGSKSDGLQSSVEVCRVFEQSFALTPWLILPALVIIVLSLLKVNVKAAMSISIACGIPLAIGIQKLTVSEMLKTVVWGYAPSNEAVRALLSGGGILSMVNVFFIVCISSSYAGIFRGTGLLDSIKKYIALLSERITPFGCVLFTSMLTSMVSCNQTLSVMLSCQLCEAAERDNYKMASYLENTAVVISPLVPWSIACAVPLSAVNAPMISILAACYLYLLPLWNFMIALINRRRGTKRPIDSGRT